MSHHNQSTATAPSDTITSTVKIRSIARLFGREAGRRRPVSIETDAKLRAAHVRAASFRPEMY